MKQKLNMEKKHWLIDLTLIQARPEPEGQNNRSHAT